MNKTDMKYKAYIQILEEELKPAMGCTEPISLAYSAAVAARYMDGLPDKVLVEDTWTGCPTKYWLKQAAVSLKT